MASVDESTPLAPGSARTLPRTIEALNTLRLFGAMMIFIIHFLNPHLAWGASFVSFFFMLAGFGPANSVLRKELEDEAAQSRAAASSTLKKVTIVDPSKGDAAPNGVIGGTASDFVPRSSSGSRGAGDADGGSSVVPEPLLGFLALLRSILGALLPSPRTLARRFIAVYPTFVVAALCILALRTPLTSAHAPAPSGDEDIDAVSAPSSPSATPLPLDGDLPPTPVHHHDSITNMSMRVAGDSLNNMNMTVVRVARMLDATTTSPPLDACAILTEFALIKYWLPGMYATPEAERVCVQPLGGYSQPNVAWFISVLALFWLMENAAFQLIRAVKRCAGASGLGLVGVLLVVYALTVSVGEAGPIPAVREWMHTADVAQWRWLAFVHQVCMHPCGCSVT